VREPGVGETLTSVPEALFPGEVTMTRLGAACATAEAECQNAWRPTVRRGAAVAKAEAVAKAVATRRTFRGTASGYVADRGIEIDRNSGLSASGRSRPAAC